MKDCQRVQHDKYLMNHSVYFRTSAGGNKYQHQITAYLVHNYPLVAVLVCGAC